MLRFPIIPLRSALSLINEKGIQLNQTLFQGFLVIKNKIMPRTSKNKKKNKTETENQDDRPKWKPITMNELAEASLQFCIRPALAAVPNANGANNADGPSKAMNPTIHISPPVSLAENGGKKEV